MSEPRKSSGAGAQSAAGLSSHHPSASTLRTEPSKSDFGKSGKSTSHSEQPPPLPQQYLDRRPTDVSHSDEHELEPAEQSSKPTMINKYDHGWRRIVRNFGPAWFSVPMATGIMAAQIILIPYQARWLWYLCLIMFFLNIIFWVGAVLLSILRYTLYPEIWTAMLHDPRSFIFLGACPIALATIVEVMCTAIVPYVGPWCVTAAWVIWMINAVFSSATTIFVCYLLTGSSAASQLSDVNASQLLPISSSVVSAGIAARVAQVLPNPNRALGVLITGYIQWGIAVPLIFTVLAMYYHRLVVHRLPPKPLIISCFVPMGPLGFGGFGAMVLGKDAMMIFPQIDSFPGISQNAGEILYVVGFLVAIVMWSFGLVFCAFAVASIVRNYPIPFTMAYWGLIFPIGVYSASALQMGAELESATFKMLGTIITVLALVLYVLIFIRTCYGIYDGKILVSPDMSLLSKEHIDKGLVPAHSYKMA